MTLRSYNGKQPEIASSAYIDEAALVIGDVTIGADSSIWPMSVLRGDVHSIKIGERTNIQDACVCHVTHDGLYTPGGFPLQVGNDVTVGHRVTLHACTVGDLCLIGMSATIMDGAIIGPKSIIAAAALVPTGMELEGGYLYVGVPVKKVRALTDRELESLEYSARHYVDVKNNHQARA